MGNAATPPNQAYVADLLAESCFDTKFDRDLFQAWFGKPSSSNVTLRHDESGYGGDFQGGLNALADWLLGVLKDLPQGLAGDAVKFWLYYEALKRLPDAKLGNKADELVKKLRAYLEKQVK